MSCSRLYGLTENTDGVVLCELSNGLLFAPSVWSALYFVYFKEELKGRADANIVIDSICPIKGEKYQVFEELNTRLNNSLDLVDRVMWEFSNESVFETKNKDLVLRCMHDFLEKYKEHKDFQNDRVLERFQEYITDLSSICEWKYPYFVLKNTSVDDNVVKWFFTGDGERRTLKEYDGVVTMVTFDDAGGLHICKHTDYFLGGEIL